ncbi:MAG: glycosyltransferase family 2 protein [Chloroflexi bacterium]|nr:glycosyltransferase family 2 protein [Chloroflexota bacterium]
MAQVQALQSDVEPGTARVLVAIPAYNEDRFIGSLVLKLRAAGYRVLVVDDGSADLTAEVAEAAGAAVVRHPANVGKTAAVRRAFERARELEVEALVLLDGDSQHDPAEVGRVVAPVLAGQADMVVGSRFVGAHSRIPRWRVAGQHALTLATNLGSGLHLSDSQSGFRAFSRRALQGMSFHRAGFSVESEMQFEAKALGLAVLEVPIHVHYQLPTKRSPIRQGLSVLEAVLRLVAQHRPLLFFSAPGLVVLLAGLALGLHVVRTYEATLTLAVGYALITVLLCIVGILAIFVGVMLHSIRELLRDEGPQVHRSEP